MRWSRKTSTSIEGRSEGGREDPGDQFGQRQKRKSWGDFSGDSEGYRDTNQLVTRDTNASMMQESLGAESRV